VSGNEGRSICSTGGYSDNFNDPVKTSSENTANARRIVACVNALEGFDIAAIEAGVVKQLIEALRQAKTLLQPYAKTMPDNATSEAFHRISTSIALIAPATDIKDQG
jgi:hypothetical protein